MGVVVTKTGYYVSIKSLPMSNLREVVNDLWKKAPFMFLGAAVAIVGTALLCRIGLETSTVEWAAYCVITGIGIGIGIQLPYTAVQAVLKSDIPRNLVVTNTDYSVRMIYLVAMVTKSSLSLAEKLIRN